MRPIGPFNDRYGNVPPDNVINLTLAGGTAQAQDYPSDSNIMRVTGLTTANLPLHFFVNMSSTGAAPPTTGATTASTLVQLPVIGTRTFQLSGGATGFSVHAQTSGYFVAEFYGR